MTQLDELYKFGAAEPDEQPWSPGRVFSRGVTGGTMQITISASVDQVGLLETLLTQMPEPFWLLYVLVVSRGEGHEGRYQSSEPVTLRQATEFLNRYKHFMEMDGRHNVWFKSDSGPGLLVLDRHNLIYGYGLVDEWADTLQKMGWREVEQSQLTLPDPHAHHYHAIFDDDANDILSFTEWELSGLREQDY
jgi:hypothetical protein